MDFSYSLSRQVLLVLDGVGALVEEGDQEAQDELLQFLCSLSERKDSYKLKLLVTSNAKLQHWSSACFRSGSEQVKVHLALVERGGGGARLSTAKQRNLNL